MAKLTHSRLGQHWQRIAERKWRINYIARDNGIVWSCAIAKSRDRFQYTVEQSIQEDSPSRAQRMQKRCAVREWAKNVTHFSTFNCQLDDNNERFHVLHLSHHFSINCVNGDSALVVVCKYYGIAHRAIGVAHNSHFHKFSNVYDGGVIYIVRLS